MAKMTISFLRIVVSREFKNQLRLVRASGSRAPTVLTYALYLNDTAKPATSWPLYAWEEGRIAFGKEAVQVAATIDNPLRGSAALIYDPSIWTGLEFI